MRTSKPQGQKLFCPQLDSDLSTGPAVHLVTNKYLRDEWAPGLLQDIWEKPAAAASVTAALCYHSTGIWHKVGVLFFF